MTIQDFFSTVKTNPFEIVKASDMDVGFQSIVDNASFLVRLAVQAEHDFIIGGQVTPIKDSLSVRVSPFIAFNKKTQRLLCKGTETIVELKAAHATKNRRDVLFITEKGWVDFKKENRARWFVARGNAGQTGQENSGFAKVEPLNKRQAFKVALAVISGENNSGTAKYCDEECVKLGEISVKASQTKFGKEDIFAVSALAENEENAGWTNETMRTFSLAPMSKAAMRFFKIHKPDGTLKDGVVGKSNLALSGGDMLTGDDIVIGKKIAVKAGSINPATGAFEYTIPFVGTERLEFTIFESAKIKEVFDVVFNAFAYVWKTFIANDAAVYRYAQGYTDLGIADLNKVFFEALQKEIQERIAAIDKEAKERKEADAAIKTFAEEAIAQEAQERKEADEKETKERKEADAEIKTFTEEAIAQEAQERKEADEKEAKERKEADAEIKTFAEEAITQEAQERKEADEIEATARIAGDKQIKELAEEAISLSVPEGSTLGIYDDEEHKTFLKLDGKSFEPAEYPRFYEYWKEHLAFLGEDNEKKPFLPYVETADYSRLGEVVSFIGTDYHHEFLLCDGGPFSPDVYAEFYEQYWKKHLSHLGKDSIGWPLRPKLKGSIAGSNVYIKALPHVEHEFITPVIKTGK
ncbi:hypothetical protein FUT79_08375 [Treponema phagedenis]|uniref:hypothetical protein n=1 Tax=Treponema phagedenis TaxID=162 RepID=UPI0011E63A10|nr:hypothetical protein [Treponema phagedenis]QEJ95212.1 hypothetical protein FUT79_08375 [Treponema phagedenis]